MACDNCTFKRRWQLKLFRPKESSNNGKFLDRSWRKAQLTASGDFEISTRFSRPKKEWRPPLSWRTDNDEFEKHITNYFFLFFFRKEEGFVAHAHGPRERSRAKLSKLSDPQRAHLKRFTFLTIPEKWKCASFAKGLVGDCFPHGLARMRREKLPCELHERTVHVPVRGHRNSRDPIGHTDTWVC